ncbi:MAG: TlyA family RNA methyltransferase [Firmicutes bacterium]|nr:TlyA family RNA methyltransferase [Bacillota bacterium]
MKRVDIIIKEKFGLSRQKVQQLIKEGAVTVNKQPVKKPSQTAEETDEIEIADNTDTLRYAGRGGLKLEGALGSFGLDIGGRICIDIGASTGGFTDCMLQNGAKCVYSVDVGTAQLARGLRDDSRVHCFENTNIKDFVCDEAADFIAADVSFVSLEKIFPEIDRLLCGGCAVVLVKPQFEAGREHLSKNGIVRDIKVHKNILKRLVSAAAAHGLYCTGLVPSPIKGGDGNTEYLMLLERTPADTDISALIKQAVGQ